MRLSLDDFVQLQHFNNCSILCSREGITIALTKNEANKYIKYIQEVNKLNKNIIIIYRDEDCDNFYYYDIEL